MARITRETLSAWEDRRRAILSQGFRVETGGSRERRIERARRDFDYFARTYFPHLCTSPCGSFHRQAAERIKCSPHAFDLYMWPRGHAKSTMLSLIIPLWLCCQEHPEIHLMVLVSQSQEKAILLLGEVRLEIENNALLRSDFDLEANPSAWSEDRFRTTSGILFCALGRGQSPRGIRNGAYRPDYIVVDDIDDDELVRSSSRVAKVTEWVLSALYGSMAMGRGRFVVVGNLIGKDSVIARLRASGQMRVSEVYTLTAKGQPWWRENYTLAEIEALRARIGERMFQKEYMHNPTVEGSIFRDRDIRFAPILPLREYRSLVCYTDPSFKNSATADYKATVLLGKTRQGYYHVLKAYAERATVARMVAWHYEIDAWVDGRVPVLYYMESNFMQDLLLDEFRKAGAAAGHQIPVRGDSRKKPDKFARIEAMQPLFERGFVLINQDEADSPGVRVLIDQLLMFERGSRANDDAPDALEGAIYKLSRRVVSTTPYIIGSRPSRRF